MIPAPKTDDEIISGEYMGCPYTITPTHERDWNNFPTYTYKFTDPKCEEHEMVSSWDSNKIEEEIKWFVKICNEQPKKFEGMTSGAMMIPRRIQKHYDQQRHYVSHSQMKEAEQRWLKKFNKHRLMHNLTAIQNELKAPKNQRNDFGKYNYRNCEDIMNAVKPLLEKYSLQLYVSDTMEMIGDRVYVCATATITDGTETIESTAYAREEEAKKGMDASQITGSASSYARKYALCGLFLIDGEKDADALNTSAEYTQKQPKATKAAKVATAPAPVEKSAEDKRQMVLSFYQLNPSSTNRFRESYGIDPELAGDDIISEVYEMLSKAKKI